MGSNICIFLSRFCNLLLEWFPRNLLNILSSEFCWRLKIYLHSLAVRAMFYAWNRSLSLMALKVRRYKGCENIFRIVTFRNPKILAINLNIFELVCYALLWLCFLWFTKINLFVVLAKIIYSKFCELLFRDQAIDWNSVC